MANDDTEKGNGVLIVEGVGDGEEGTKELTLYIVFNRLIAAVFLPDRDSPAPLLKRIKSSLSANIPLLGKASRNSGLRVLIWTRRGGPLRALLVVCVGTIALLVLTGLLVFMLFFLAATVNAVVISLLVSLAAAGGFLALFFVCVAAIYVAALSVAVFVISTATISAVIAVLIVTGKYPTFLLPVYHFFNSHYNEEIGKKWDAVSGRVSYISIMGLLTAVNIGTVLSLPSMIGWIGFFWTLWLAAKKSISLAKHSLSMTGSAVSSYTSAWHARDHKVSKKSD